MRRPKTLWHYTDAAGMYGIVTSSQLRFGDARLLNDRTEQIYAERLLQEVVREGSLPDKHGVIASALESIDSSQHPIRLYVCSFSETRESISQWQRYGADGAGYCIGFDVSELDALFGEYLWRKRMRYQPGKQRELLRKKLRVASAVQEEWPTFDKSTLEFEFLIGAAKLGADLDDAMLQIKNPFFEDEREWRYVLMKDARAQDGKPTSPEQFTPRGVYVKPFIAIPPLKGTTAQTKLPVRNIVCGPKLNFEIAEPATKRFLASHGYKRVKVERSELVDIWR